jgi:hypothetical protein
MPASGSVVPHAFTGYFTAAATAAGALIGLLFVAISFRSDTIFGPKSMPGGEALAITAFTGLVNAFFVALLALVPRINIGYGAALMAVLSGASLLRLNRRISVQRRTLTFATTLLAYTAQLVVGLILIAHPRDYNEVETLTYITIASMGVALQRAWALMRGRHIVSDGEPPRANAA